MRVAIRTGLAAVVLALSVAGCASRTTSSQPGAAADESANSSTPLQASVIPWINAPTDPPTPPPDTPPPQRPADARHCTADDVTAQLGEQDGAGGHLLVIVRLRNVSNSPCVLVGYPRVVATEPGQPDVTGTDGSFFDGRDGSANMAPGESTMFGLETDTYCAARPDGGGGNAPYHTVEITLPDDHASIGLTDSAGLDVTCGLHLSQFWVPRPPTPDPPGSDDDLTVALDLPASVTSGNVLTYYVDLTNPTDRSISLLPCPAYLQGAPGVKDFEALNCAALTAIGPGDTVRFEMRMQTAGMTQTGPTTIFWVLMSPSVAAKAQGTVEVLAH